LRAQQNILSDQIAQQRTEALISQAKELKQQIQAKQEDLDTVLQEWEQLMLLMPNLAHPAMISGKGEEDNLELKVWLPDQGYLPQQQLGTGYEARQYMPVIPNAEHHLDLGAKLDIIDVEQSAKVSGSRFAYLKNEAVLLQFAVIDLLKNKLLEENFTPMIPPVLVRERALVGTSHFPLGRDQVYKIDNEFVEEQNELYLVGSSEPSLFAYYMDQIIPNDQLPAKMFAITSCFRTEVGSWGKDVRGIKRVHQFDKLEMDVVCHPENSQAIMDELLSINEWLLQQLKLPYQVVEKCLGDAGYLASHRQWDVNVWLPGQQEFMEVMTDTNATDFQARRLNIRYREEDGSLAFVHTVNDTGVALGRMIVAILDNYQQPDGTVKIPEALQAYIKKDTILPQK
jgi:seryl-tRNA synthetase